MSDNLLTEYELDVMGEVANISMGNAATTLGMMVNRRVEITTPTVSLINRSASLDDYDKTCFFVQIHYVKGVEGNNVLILKERDVKVMTDLMMMGDGTNIPDELTELHLSAVSEAMNQMMGTAATSLSQFLEREIDISPPEVNSIDVESVKIFEKMFVDPSHMFVKIAFRLTIEELIDSTMVQLYPVPLAKSLCELFPSPEE